MAAMAAPERISPRVILVIAVAALGYFVDLFDLVLFSILRVPSLQALGITDPQELRFLLERLDERSSR